MRTIYLHFITHGCEHDTGGLETTENVARSAPTLAPNTKLKVMIGWLRAGSPDISAAPPSSTSRRFKIPHHCSLTCTPTQNPRHVQVTRQIKMLTSLSNACLFPAKLIASHVTTGLITKEFLCFLLGGHSVSTLAIVEVPSRRFRQGALAWAFQCGNKIEFGVEGSGISSFP